MDMQIAYDLAYYGIINQGRPSLRPSRVGEVNGIATKSVCAYRDGLGNKCGIGHLIADSQYVPKFDDGMNTGVSILLGSDIRFKAAIMKTLPDFLGNSEEINFLTQLQIAHDEAALPDDDCKGRPFIELFKANMCNVAEEFNLDSRQ